jgi:tripartite-type tricarboxylate transporter receptor subunit TctC
VPTTTRIETFEPTVVRLTNRRRVLKAFLRCARAGTFLLAASGWAAVYPDKPVRIIVPYPPGGPTDILARLIGEKLTNALKQPVLIDNRAGAGGVVGSELAAKSAPDGYVVLWGTSGSHAINATLHPRLPYDPVKDFAPITLVAKGMNILVVHPSLPVRSVNELVALARTQPGRMNFASAGNGATSHLAGEMFKLHSGAAITHVPFKGATPAIAAVMSGEVEMAILDIPALLPHIRSGKLRALGVASLRRSAVLPELPTLDETGLSGFDTSSWHAMFAPARTPLELVARLNAAARNALRTPDVAERLAVLGVEPVGNTPEALAEFLRQEIVRWGKVVKQSGAKSD